MATTKTSHVVRTEYPLAGSDDGIEIDIAFTYRGGSPDYWNKAGGHWEQGYAAEVEFLEVDLAMTTWRLPKTIMDAIENWARNWLDDDDGYGRACDKALDARQAEREQAAEYRREA